MKYRKGTPQNLKGALANGLEEIFETPDMSREKMVDVLKAHVRDFAAQVASCPDDEGGKYYLELFEKIFDETPQGYVLALQWYQGAKSLKDFDGPLYEKGDAKVVSDLVGRQLVVINPIRPPVPKGYVLFKVLRGGELRVIETNYDTSD